MHSETKDIWKNIYDFSLSVLGRSICDVTFSEMLRPNVHHIALVSAAHGTELLIKAAIAKEHPLLIFERLPKLKEGNELLMINSLFEKGQTYTYSSLPDLLWASTGFKLSEDQLRKYNNFGYYRNQTIHLGKPAIDAGSETLSYLFTVTDYICQDIFGHSILEYVFEWDEVALDGYLLESLINLGVPIHNNTKEELLEKESD